MPQHSLRPYYRVRLAIAGVPTIRRASARSFAPALLTLPQVASSAAGSLFANRRSAAGCALAPKLASSAPLSSRARTSSLASRLRRLHDLLASDSSLVRTSRASNAFPNSRGAGHWCALAAQHPARLVFASAAAAFAGASPARVCVLAPPLLTFPQIATFRSRPRALLQVLPSAVSAPARTPAAPALAAAPAPEHMPAAPAPAKPR